MAYIRLNSSEQYTHVQSDDGTLSHENTTSCWRVHRNVYCDVISCNFQFAFLPSSLYSKSATASLVIKQSMEMLVHEFKNA